MAIMMKIPNIFVLMSFLLTVFSNEEIPYTDQSCPHQLNQIQLCIDEISNFIIKINQFAPFVVTQFSTLWLLVIIVPFHYLIFGWSKVKNIALKLEQTVEVLYYHLIILNRIVHLTTI